MNITKVLFYKRRCTFDLIILMFFLTILSSRIAAQEDRNEEIIFSFNTQSGKKVTLSKEKENKYIIYRFGTKAKIEFEFPDTTKSSWTQFKYSFYLRGGGTENEGMDLNYIYFTNKNYKYIIYDTYFARDNKQNIGVKIVDLKTNKITNIKGNLMTRKGSLTGFRDNELLEIGDELFD